MTEVELRDLVAGFCELPVANISDNLERSVGARGIRPYHRGGKLAGIARTVKTAPGDNAFIYRAFEQANPGDVLVVDGGGFLDRALIGEIMVSIALSRRLGGMVLDGAIRDIASISEGDFPIFARGVIHLGPYKNGPGELGGSVSIGGMIVSQGDIIVGDEDGVVAFPAETGRALLEATKAQAQREAKIIDSIRAGTYTPTY